MKKIIKIEAMHGFHVGELEELEARLIQTAQASPADREVMEKKACCDSEEDENEFNPFYSVVNGTAVFRVDGPLISTSSWMTRWLGYTSYEDVREGMMMAARDPQVSDVLMLIGSPGGSVFGITDAAEIIRKVDAAKPVYAYSNKNMCSGAYWLGATARKLFTSAEAEIGSIGVIMTHFSYEKQIEENGVKVTVIKSAEMKAIGGPYKDLTDKEVAHIQEQVDQYDNLFKTHVQSERPGVKFSAMNGATYIGAEAVKVGLADAVMSYDEVMNYIQTNRVTSTQNGGYGMKMTAVQLQTALDAGQTLADLQLSEDEAKEILATEPEILEPEVVEVEDDGAKKGKGKGKGKGGCATPEDETALSALTEQLTAQAGRIADKDKQIAELQSQVTDFEAHAAELKKIVAEVTTNRRVALGLMGSVDLTTFTVPTLLAEYSAITEQFSKAMKIGGLFGGKDTTKTTPPAPVAVAGDSIENGRLQASSI